jgi:hypothetical protein
VGSDLHCLPFFNTLHYIVVSVLFSITYFITVSTVQETSINTCHFATKVYVNPNLCLSSSYPGSGDSAVFRESIILSTK